MAKCPQCWKEIVTPVSRKIIDRGTNPITGKAWVRERVLVFCSETCGGHYQMGCEG